MTNTTDTTTKPPVLPDTSGWVQRQPGDVIEAGTPYVVWHSDGSTFYAQDDHDSPFTVDDQAIWTPPPAEPPVWSVLSTDREKPTLAKVTFDGDGYKSTGLFWRNNETGKLRRADSVSSIGPIVDITSVELLHTFDRSTHVPVERALIDEILDFGTTNNAARALAALADGNQS